MRSKPSGEDLALILRLREEREINVSPSQLERWRGRGLLRRAKVVREGFGGTSVLPHDEETVEAAALLGLIARRSRPWQLDALVMFEEGFDLSPTALRETATFLVEVQLKPMRKAWARAEREASPSDDPDEEAGEIGELAAALLTRRDWRGVREEVALAHPTATAADIREYVDRAMTWRMVDLAVPSRLSEEQRNFARHGRKEPMPVLGGVGVFPLPSERLVVAQTLSWAEADLYREFALLRINDEPRLEVQGAFTIMTWIVAGERRNAQPDALDIPLPQSHLDADRQLLDQIRKERSE